MAIHAYDHGDGYIQIWSNCEDSSDHDGRCIGIGDTLEEAKADAENELLKDLAALALLTEVETVS